MHFPIFEAVMMLCFGMAWPVSILKSWRSRTNKGKSPLFLLIVLTGYVSGLVHKLWWQAQVDGVVWLYVLNAAMVALVAWLVPGFQVSGFWTAVGAALIVSLVSWAASSMIGGNGRVEIFTVRK